MLSYNKKNSFFVAVVVVNAYQRATEGQYLAESDEERVVDFTYRRGDEPRCQQCAPEGAHCSSDDELQAFHLIKNFELRGYGFDHRTARNYTELRIYISCFRAFPCLSVVGNVTRYAGVYAFHSWFQTY